MRPNPSLEWTATGKPLGPRASQCHHPSRGPSGLPASAPSAQTLDAVELTLYRRSGHIGQAVPLDVLVDGRRIGALRVNEHFSTKLSAPASELQVSLQGSVGSPAFRLPQGVSSIKLECGNPLWVALDLLSLCYLAPLRDHVFYLREPSDASSKGAGV